MSKWDKLIARICSLSKDLRFNELRKVLESYGYEMNAPRSGSVVRQIKCLWISQINQGGFSTMRALSAI